MSLLTPSAFTHYKIIDRNVEFCERNVIQTRERIADPAILFTNFNNASKKIEQCAHSKRKF